MNVEEFYAVIGGNYAEALGRLMKDSLIEKFVLKFTDDPSFATLKSAVDAGAWDEAFPAAHTLKGVSLNLAFTPLGQAASELTDMLRPQNAESRDESVIKAKFAEVEKIYRELIDTIGAYTAD